MDIETKRLSRLTSILIQLQSGKIVNASKLADKFGTSIRTIYRDMKVLENAGVPIVTEEGKGYSVLDGYKIPPVMFTETESNALLTAELIIKASKDTSLISDFESAVAKVRAVMPAKLKFKSDRLERKMGITNHYIDKSPKSRYLSDIQHALIECLVIKINYTDKGGKLTQRSVEPFAVYTNQHSEWIMVAYCRMRRDFRSFSLSSILEVFISTETFVPQKVTLAEFLDQKYGNKRTAKAEP